MAVQKYIEIDGGREREAREQERQENLAESVYLLYTYQEGHLFPVCAGAAVCVSLP